MTSNTSIIIAEDDPVNQKVTLLMLRKLGIRAETVSNGLEVLQALEKESYDIVLMDIQMPKMDGIEATKIIRERWPQRPKIIVITDCDSNAYREPCLDAGANEFLAKPVMVKELTEAIEHCGIATRLSATSCE
jgi:CheY-like chemotaxis protein